MTGGYATCEERVMGDKTRFLWIPAFTENCSMHFQHFRRPWRSGWNDEETGRNDVVCWRGTGVE